MRSPTRRAGGSLILLFAATLAAAPSSSRPAYAAGCTPPPVGDVTATGASGSGFVAVTPQRLADTRLGIGGVPVAPVGAGCVLQVDLAAVAPFGATAAVLTITADRTLATTFVTAYGCGGPRPGVSHLNPRRNDPVPGLAVVPLDATGRACLYADDTTDLIVDLVGWYAPAGEAFHELTLVRAVDTRTRLLPTDPPPVRPPDGGVVRVDIAGGQLPGIGVAVPGVATAVAINVTITNASRPTYATAYPCTADRPGTSTVNTLPGFDRGAPAIVGFDPSGAVCVFVERSADVIIDVTGWFGPDDPAIASSATVPGSRVREFAARRLADSRSGIGGWARAKFAAGEVRPLGLPGRVAIGATAVQLEAIAVDATGPGYLTLFPCADLVPITSSVNFRPGQPESSLVTIGLARPPVWGQPSPGAVPGAGDICVLASAATDVVIDLLTVFGENSALRILDTTPDMDREPLNGQPDHTVRCPAGGGPVTIDAAAAPGGVVSVNHGPATVRSTVTLTMQPDDVATIDVTFTGGVQHTYLRCLPPDFPPLRAVGKSPGPGWVQATTAAAAAYAFILDEYGVPVWYKRTPYPVIGLWADGGGVAWRRWTGGGFPTEVPPLGFELRSLTGELTGTIEIPGEAIDWHELLTLPDGNRLVVTYPRRDLPPATTVPCNDTNGVPRTTNVMIDSDVVELDPAGNEVWRWHSADHIAAAETQLPVCFLLAGGAYGLDLVHVNAIDIFPDGDLLLTARHLNAVMRIDRATGAVEWKLGGTAPGEGAALTIVGDARGGPRAPHDGRVLPDGNVTMHDNHVGAIDATSRAVEYTVDTTAARATLAWSHSAGTLKSVTLGSVRRLADGTTVIGWGTGSAPWLEQVAADGTRLLTVSAARTDVIYRAESAPASAWDRDTLRGAAGGAAPPAP